MTNHLAHESSPYLLQHKDNPVDWYPWGDEALDRAWGEDKPIFLSIGYSACHWCHVMAHESFEDPQIAALMNASFISIKVDREQRPDLDSIYMSFVVATTGGGGWPLSVFLTPDAKPFYGGTYFPPEPTHNLPAFRDLLATVSRLWQTDRQAVLSSSENLTRELVRQQAVRGTAAQSLPSDFLANVTRTLSESYDWQNGGWGGAPKFPQPMLIEFLLRQAVRGNHVALDMALNALRAMAQGGMYDVLAGGFARYSVDNLWLVPHFEKMLYDNAQLARVYLRAWQLTGDPSLRQVCEATLDFVLRELSHPGGGFYSSLDADSEGEEGKYYLWTPAEIRAALADPAEAELFMAAYGVTEQGNFDGHIILRKVLSDEQLAAQFHLGLATIPGKLSQLHSRLLAVRTSRVHPATDDKVLVSWSSLMLLALAEAGRALGRMDYLQSARQNARFILQHLFVEGRLKRSWRDGVAQSDAFLEDYAAFGLAMLALYQADPDPGWYQASLQMLEHLLGHFVDPQGGFYDTSDQHESIIYRPKNLQDNATPSGNALAAMLLLELGSYEGRSDWHAQAEQLITGMQANLSRYPAAFGFWLTAADYALGPVHEVAIVGNLEAPATLSLLEPVWQGYHPRLVLAASQYPPPAGSPPLLSDRPLLNGSPTVYVCQDFVCRQPVNDPQELSNQLQATGDKNSSSTSTMV